MDASRAPSSILPPAPKRASLVTRLKSRVGIRGRLILGFHLLLMIALGTTSILFVSKSRTTLKDILGEQARQISQTLAMAAEAPYEGGDAQQLQKLGSELLKSRNIVLVVFFDPSGSPLALACRDPDFNLRRWRGGGSSQQLDPTRLMQVYEHHLPTLGPFLEVTAPVFDRANPVDGNTEMDSPAQTQLLGYLTVGISQANEQTQLQRVSILGVALGLLIFLLTLPIASVLVHRIFLPIRQLVDAANRVAAGDYEAKVATNRRDEIGILSRSFNEMATRVRHQQYELRIANERLAEANRDLEEKVHLRTSELESTNKRLSSEIAEKEDFLRAVSHDLNAPLRNISGMAAMLLVKYREKFDSDVVHRLERIQKNVEMETDLITELLELSRIKTRRQRMDAVDMEDLVREVGGMFEEDLKSRQISLITDTALPVVLCEKARLRQVFQNLIDNAIKYMGERPVREIHIGHTLSDEGVVFYVRDTGIGIDREDLAKVFFVFRRGKNSAGLNVSGKGVGLASVKSIIETYDGRIWVDSEVGVGSVFKFSIHKKFFPAMGGTAEQAADGGDLEAAA